LLPINVLSPTNGYRGYVLADVFWILANFSNFIFCLGVSDNVVEPCGFSIHHGKTWNFAIAYLKPNYGLNLKGFQLNHWNPRLFPKISEICWKFTKFMFFMCHDTVPSSLFIILSYFSIKMSGKPRFSPLFLPKSFSMPDGGISNLSFGSYFWDFWKTFKISGFSEACFHIPQNSVSCW
jgi:hypothetical protein